MRPCCTVGALAPFIALFMCHAGCSQYRLDFDISSLPAGQLNGDSVFWYSFDAGDMGCGGASIPYAGLRCTDVSCRTSVQQHNLGAEATLLAWLDLDNDETSDLEALYANPFLDFCEVWLSLGPDDGDPRGTARIGGGVGLRTLSVTLQE